MEQRRADRVAAELGLRDERPGVVARRGARLALDSGPCPPPRPASPPPSPALLGALEPRPPRRRPGLRGARPARRARGAKGDRPLVIGHRGAAGYRPEHTLAGYELGPAWGPTTSSPTSSPRRTASSSPATRTRSRRPRTSRATRSSPRAGRRRPIDGVPITGWFTEDFTLAELKTLRAKERIPALRPRNTLYDGRYESRRSRRSSTSSSGLSRELHRAIGIYPETKHPTYFRSIGLPLEERLRAGAAPQRPDKPNAAVFVQSFETANLRALDRLVKVPLVQLLGAPAQKPNDFTASGDPRTYADL